LILAISIFLRRKLSSAAADSEKRQTAISKTRPRQKLFGREVFRKRRFRFLQDLLQQPPQAAIPLATQKKSILLIALPQNFFLAFGDSHHNPFRFSDPPPNNKKGEAYDRRFAAAAGGACRLQTASVSCKTENRKRRFPKLGRGKNFLAARNSKNAKTCFLQKTDSAAAAAGCCNPSPS
jgi:hypothetical protein